MRATEFIRQLLDLIDSADNQSQTQTTDFEDESIPSEVEPKSEYSNSPDTQLASMDNILSIGNDVNKPKHPADIRVSTIALYPNTSYSGDK